MPRTMFTLAQSRETVGLSVTTCRHWQEALPTFGARNGRTARFTFGDLVALAVLRCMVDDVGLKISQFASSDATLFESCNELKWIGETHAYVVTVPIRDDAAESSRRDVSEHRVSIVRGDALTAIERAAVIIALDPIAGRLRSLLFGGAITSSDPQGSLALPPVPLVKRSRNSRSAPLTEGDLRREGKQSARRLRKSRNIAG